MTKIRVVHVRNKGEVMKAVYTADEIGNIDSAVPIQYWKVLDTNDHVTNHNDNGMFGKVECLSDMAVDRGIRLVGWGPASSKIARTIIHTL
jgi:hypothetical protein